MLATINHLDLSTIGWIIAAGCVLVAAYLGYIGNVAGTVLLLVVAIVAAVLLT